MNCKECRALIGNLIWDDEKVEENDLLKFHIKECRACETFYYNYLKAIKGIRSELRVKADSTLHSKIQYRLENPTKKQSNHPVIKLVWYLTVGVAAVISGIYAGTAFTKDSLQKSDQELYRQEITMQSNDISGLDSGLVDYFNY